jgi:hypothetical protein
MDTRRYLPLASSEYDVSSLKNYTLKCKVYVHKKCVTSIHVTSSNDFYISRGHAHNLSTQQ